jgi:hypothetical protein
MKKFQTVLVGLVFLLPSVLINIQSQTTTTTSAGCSDFNSSTCAYWSRFGAKFCNGEHLANGVDLLEACCVSCAPWAALTTPTRTTRVKPSPLSCAVTKTAF